MVSVAADTGNTVECWQQVDHQVSAGNKFFVRSSWNRHRQLSRLSAYINNKELDSATPGLGRPNPIDQQNWAFADYHTFSPTLMNEVRLGFGRRASTITPPTAGQGWAQKLGIPNVDGANFPSFISGSGTEALYNIGPGAFSRTINEDVTFQNNVTKVMSRHTIKFGYELIRTRENHVDQVLPSGNYSFTTGGKSSFFAPPAASFMVDQIMMDG